MKSIAKATVECFNNVGGYFRRNPKGSRQFLLIAAKKGKQVEQATSSPFFWL